MEGGKHPPSGSAFRANTIHTGYTCIRAFLHVEVFFVKHWLNHVIKQVTQVDVKT